ncbi:hypothetical protein [Streptomyces sp. NPDC047079]|uniref:hypothetical protein n=1 Tax=Streptomyces sp. NPDC047079 TaxID=3154607 RepID=UPI00340BB816
MSCQRRYDRTDTGSRSGGSPPRSDRRPRHQDHGVDRQPSDKQAELVESSLTEAGVDVRTGVRSCRARTKAQKNDETQ